MFGMGRTKEEALAALGRDDREMAERAIEKLTALRAGARNKASFGKPRELVSEEVVQRLPPEPTGNYRKPGTRHTHKPVGRQARFGSIYVNRGHVISPNMLGGK